MTRYYKLESALAHRSRTRPFAFVIAHECHEPYQDESGAIKHRAREYYAFDDVEHYKHLKMRYPHAHEVIYGRGGPGSAQYGRLAFDFDVEGTRSYAAPGKANEFVAPSFEKDVERCVRDTFRLYYVDVDLSRLRFVWLATPHADKYSRHLIVNGALFYSDWVVQSQTFYPLFKLVAHRSGLFGYLPIDRLVDCQIARTNATFRMAWCSKLNGPMMRPTRTHWEDGTELTLYDTLVQVHRREEAKHEQRVADSGLAIDRVLALVTSLGESDTVERLLVRSVPQLRRSLEDMERKEGEASLELTESCLECLAVLGECYGVRSVSEGKIVLDRVEPGECPISGRVHDSEGGYVLVSPEGDATFRCFRKCALPGGSTGLLLKRGVSVGIDRDECIAALVATVRQETVSDEPRKEERAKPVRRGKTPQKIAGEARHAQHLDAAILSVHMGVPDDLVLS